MIENIYERSKILSKTCLKIALVLPQNTMGNIAKDQLIERLSNLAIKSKGLLVTQNPEFFLKKLNDAREAVDGCYYWLEIAYDEKWIDIAIIEPVLKECDAISKLFGMAIKKIKPNG